MAAAQAKPPLGTVIEQADGSHSVWTGKAFVPAKQSAGGWGVDQEAMARLGLGGNGAGGNISPIEQKRVDEMQSDFQNVDGLASNAADFMQHNAKTDTGGILAVPGATKVAKAIPLLGGSDDLAAMDRINNVMATQMRAPGMRLTQMEFGKFLGATPSPANSEKQNTGVTKDIYAARTVAAAKSSFYSSWLNSHRTLAGADAAWLNWRGQHFDPTLSTYSHDPITADQPDPAPAAVTAAPKTPADYQAYLAQKFSQ